MLVSCLAYYFMAICSSETSVELYRTTQHYFPEVGLFILRAIGRGGMD
jgi:hypothetical protein